MVDFIRRLFIIVCVSKSFWNNACSTQVTFDSYIIESYCPILFFIYSKIDGFPCKLKKKIYQKTQFVKHQQDTLTNQLTNKIEKLSNNSQPHSVLFFFVESILLSWHHIHNTTHDHTPSIYFVPLSTHIVHKIVWKTCGENDEDSRRCYVVLSSYCRIKGKTKGGFMGCWIEGF